MLSVADYNQLKLLYDHFFKCNSHIKELILQERFEDVDIAVQEKEGLLRQIIFFEKPRLADIKQNDELNKIRLELIELEKNNIELVKSMKEKLIKELSGVKKTKKVISAYAPQVNETTSTIDVVDEE
ncbi:MAG: hypothetical protein IJ877_05505 [Candidatus Gastranaerophilales bacterium]|nr:hypothetical protein [Candidatus Gastranaerophilales bacterium]